MARLKGEVGEPAPKHRLHELGLELSRWAQDTLGGLDGVMQVITFLGNEEFFVFVFPVVLWSISRPLGIQLGLMLLLSSALNGLLKLAFATPRPLFLDPQVGVVTATSFGLPSGHAQDATAIWGLAAHELKHRWKVGWAYPAAIALIALISWSRLHLGVHFLEDVVVGILVGALLLIVYLWLRPRAKAWLVRRSKLGQIGVALGVSLTIIAVGSFMKLALADFRPPAAWIGADAVLIEEAAGVAGSVDIAGALFGLSAGLVLLAIPAGFTADGRVWQRLARYPIGLAGLAAIFLGLGAIVPGGEDPLALMLRFLRYGLVGFWIGGVAPYLFVKLGLSSPSDDSEAPSVRGTF